MTAWHRCAEECCIRCSDLHVSLTRVLEVMVRHHISEGPKRDSNLAFTCFWTCCTPIQSPSERLSFPNFGQGCRKQGRSSTKLSTVQNLKLPGPQKYNAKLQLFWYSSRFEASVLHTVRVKCCYRVVIPHATPCPQPSTSMPHPILGALMATNVMVAYS